MTGLETAELLSRAGNDVTVVEMAGEIAPGTWFQLRDDEMERLLPAGVRFLTNKKLIAVGDKDVTLQDMRGGHSFLPADAVVLSLGVRPVRGALYDELKQLHQRVIPIGDAVQSGTIADAVHSGYDAAIRLI